MGHVNEKGMASPRREGFRGALRLCGLDWKKWEDALAWRQFLLRGPGRGPSWSGCREGWKGLE